MVQTINAHNNERIFFADTVVMVEGPSDELFWRQLIAQTQGSKALFPIIEIISVNGKHNFLAYRQLDILRYANEERRKRTDPSMRDIHEISQ